MVHLVAILYFAGMLVGLALVLQYTIRGSWDEMKAAVLGRPMPRHAPRRSTAVTASVPRSRMWRAAA